jgi:hypothetical protein
MMDRDDRDVKPARKSSPSLQQNFHRPESASNLDDSRRRRSESSNELAYNDIHDVFAGREKPAR